MGDLNIIKVRIKVNIKGYTDNDIKQFASDIMANINYVHDKRNTFDTVEYEAASRLLQNPRSSDSIDVYNARLVTFLNKNNPIVRDALLSIQTT
jgi:hypothetical protein